MPVTVSTVYTKERLLRFQHFTAASRTFFWSFMIVCTLIVMVGWVYLASFSIFSDTVNFCLAMILLMDVLYLFAYFVLPYLTVKKSKSLNSTLTYIFEENQLHLDCASPLVTESLTLQYPALYRIAKNKTELYLYTNRQTAFVADLSTLSVQQLSLLEQTFKNALPSKKVRW